MKNAKRIIYASVTEGESVPQHARVPEDSAKNPTTIVLQKALDFAVLGDLIQILPGVYDTPIVISGLGAIPSPSKSGDSEKHVFDSPIVIRGSAGVTFDGRRNLVRPPDHDRFDADNYAFVRILNCKGIVLENLTIQNVWPAAIYIGDSKGIALRRINIHGSTYAVYARASNWNRKTSDILIERCAWVQDTRIWQSIYWDDIHHPPLPRKELDGDFFRGWNVAGNVVVRKNSINHAFNGVHLFASTNKRKSVKDQVNNNVWVYQNTFSFIRDNAVEAERQAHNWWVWGNGLFNVHKWFAFEEKCSGGYWNFFSNRGWFDRKPCPKDDPYNGGAVFKFKQDKRSSGPINVFHNTWFLRSTYIKKGRMRGLGHFNNIVEYAPADFGLPGTVNPDQPVFGKRFIEECINANSEPGNEDYRFANDLSNRQEYFDKVALIMSRSAARAPDTALFANPTDGFFQLVDGSSAMARSVEVRINILVRGKDRYRQKTVKTKPSLNIGALDKAYNNKKVRSPSTYVFMPEQLGLPKDAARGPQWIATVDDWSKAEDEAEKKRSNPSWDPDERNRKKPAGGGTTSC